MTSAVEGKRRCAVIYHPIKVDVAFRETMAASLEAAGWADTHWLPTTEEDAGRTMAREALEANVNRVIGVGGDGTIRAVADVLAGTGVPLGLVPLGTGNLLARNLGLPLDREEALVTALGGRTRTIDLIAVSVDQQPDEHFAVMAGTGIDAMIMDETDPKLKDAVGFAAYFVAAGKAVGRLPMDVTIVVDEGRPLRRRAMLVLVGNVGELQGGITVLPAARPDDGELDILIASPRTVRDWLRIIRRTLIRRRRSQDPVDALRGTRVRIRLARPDSYQLDGDTVGECTELRAEVRPGALTVCVPG